MINKVIQSVLEPSSIGIIGGADGPTAVIITGSPIRDIIIFSVLLVILVTLIILFIKKKKH